MWTGNGRQLGALAVYYQMTGDKAWKKTGQGIVDRLDQLAIKAGDIAFPRFIFSPAEKLSAEEIKKAAAAMNEQSVSESEKNTALWQTWIITGLAQFYKATHYEPAARLARQLANYMRQSKYIEDWKSHFHCITLGIQAFLELAQATGDREMGGAPRKQYEIAKSGTRSIAIPEIGYFINEQGGSTGFMEGCSIADMTAIAVKLAQMGFGDQSYEDIDRYTRNLLTEDQITHPGLVAEYTRKLQEQGKAKPAPVIWTHLTDRINERWVGSWNLHFRANDHFAVDYWDPCCTGNCSRAIYYAWESILDYNKGQGELRVNLLLNRASPWADIDSYIPYQGRVEIKVKKTVNILKLRMNDWIGRGKVACTVDGKARPSRGKATTWRRARSKPARRSCWSSRSPSASRNSIPLIRRTDSPSAATAVNVEAQGAFVPLFQRDYYRSSQPRYMKVKRFV